MSLKTIGNKKEKIMKFITDNVLSGLFYFINELRYKDLISSKNFTSLRGMLDTCNYDACISVERFLIKRFSLEINPFNDTKFLMQIKY